VNGSNVGRWLVLLALALGLAGGRGTARGQVPPPQDAEDKDADSPGGRYKVLSGPDALDKLDKIGKDKLRPPFEFFRTGFAPFDVLPFVKARHWSSASVDLRSNYVDYEGLLQTLPVPLQDMPHAVVFRREARLLKGQQARLGQQVMLPAVPRELSMELTRPDGIRADETLTAQVRLLEPHQMLIMVLAKNPNDYGTWTRLHALLPTSGDKDPMGMEKQRYYRLVIPQDPEKPYLSTHPLTWTTISHVFWDSLDPDVLNPGQQQAMLDWLHWGGQLVIMGGAGSSLAMLKDSFLGPYLPADPGGENALLGASDLAPLADAYPPPNLPAESFDPETNPVGTPIDTHRYKDPVQLHPAPKRPVYFAGLRMREGTGAVELPLGQSANRLLGVERRLGRGRITMLSFSPTDPAIIAWPGLDSLLARLILRRPEELSKFITPDPRAGNPFGAARGRARPSNSWQYQCLTGPDLTWLRFLSRDLGAEAGAPTKSVDANTGEVELPRDPVAEWTDRTRLPLMCRDALRKASGITIPPSSFILKVLVAYILALVPLNWLLCRYVVKRREWAWGLVPILALGFAIGVERAAAYDMGFDSGCDEIDLLETHGAYPRGHLSRFAALFSTGRVGYTISFPNDGTALALPMNPGDLLRGEEQLRTVWQSLPVPALVGLQVQPRSFVLYRAEQLIGLGGTVQLVSDEESRRVENGTSLELHDAVLVEDGGQRQTYLGTIAPGAQVDVRAAAALDKKPAASAGQKNWLDPAPFLGPLRDYRWTGAEDLGEIRLVAWAPGLLPGQKIEPKVDRHRGLTLVVAHLAMGPPPSPDEPPYFSEPASGRPPAAKGAEALPLPAAAPGVTSTVPITRPGMRKSSPARFVSTYQAPPVQETRRP
jgi:hypothetical protein